MDCNKVILNGIEYDKDDLISRVSKGEIKLPYLQSHNDNEVKYMFESIRLMTTNKVKQEWNKLQKGNISFEQFLNNSQFPKGQKDIIREIYLESPTNSIDDLIINIASKYVYTVEVNNIKEIEHLYQDGEEYEGSEKIPTKYYSYLTVPGGTNYTENEIATPDIISSIKGHAEFSTDNGIGWFRSDDKLGDKYRIVTEKGQMTQNQSKKDAEKIASTMKGRFSFVNIELDVKAEDSFKTRRILEVQSDLFQKGRDKVDLVARPSIPEYVTDSEIGQLYDKAEIEDWSQERLTEEQNKVYDREKNSIITNPQQNQFLQLLNKDGNWIPFFLKTIVQDSAKKGYEKLLFPTGDTASKIEGHETLEEFKKQKEDRIKWLDDHIKLSEESISNPESKYNKDTQGYIAGFEGITHGDKDAFVSIVKSRKEQIEKEKKQLQEELKRVETEGFAALKPIYDFYENRIKNTLNKIYGKNNINRIKDEYGNYWYELNVDDSNSNVIFHEPYLANDSKDFSKQIQIDKAVKAFSLKENQDRFGYKGWTTLNNKVSISLKDNLNKHFNKYPDQYPTIAAYYIPGTGVIDFKTLPRPRDSKENKLFGIGVEDDKLEFHINTLNLVSKFLENIGIKQEFVTEFLNSEGNVVEGAIAAANFLQGSVQYIESNDINVRLEAWNKTPEEAAHFFYRLLTHNSELKEALTIAAYKAQRPTSEEYIKAYKNNPDSITEEVIGQLIAEAIKRIENKNGAPEDYKFLNKFLNWINELVQKFKDLFNDQDPFEIAAMKILNSDLSDLMTWDEYKMINDQINFANKITDSSINENVNIEVFDVEGEFEKLMNTKFKKRTRYLNKTLDAYFTINSIRSGYSNGPYIKDSFELNYNLDLSKKLKEQEVKDLKGYINYQHIIPTLKSLPEVLKKLGKQKISVKEPFYKIIYSDKTGKLVNITKEQFDSKLHNKKVASPITAKEKELEIYNSVLSLIRDENPTLKTISAEELVYEVYNYLKANYVLGFGEETSYLNYRIDQTFERSLSKLEERHFTDEYLNNLTDADIAQMDYTTRQRVALELGYTNRDYTPDEVRHRKISLRFNDEYFEGGHFSYTPSAWGNLTPFYSKNKNVKDAVLLHEIQNDQIEKLWKANDKEDLKKQLLKYLDDIELKYSNSSNGKYASYNKTQEYVGSQLVDNFFKPNTPFRYDIISNIFSVDITPNEVKEKLDEIYNLYIDADKRLVSFKRSLDTTYRASRQFKSLIDRGGIKSVIEKHLEESIKKFLNEVSEIEKQSQNTDEVNYAFQSRFSVDLVNSIFDYFNKNYDIDENFIRKYIYPNVFVLPKNRKKIGGINTSYNYMILNFEKKILKNINSDILSHKLSVNLNSGLIKRNEILKKLLKLPLGKIAEIQNRVKENKKFLKDAVDKRISEKLGYGESEKQLINKLIEEKSFEAINIFEEELKVYDEKSKDLRHTLELNLNYFTPLMHHLIQTHIRDYGKDTPLYFSGYQITQLTQGSENTAKIYAGPEEVNAGITQKVGPLYTAMSEFSRNNSIKINYVDVPGLTNSAAKGYQLDLTNYNYKEPILYGIRKNNTIPESKGNDTIDLDGAFNEPFVHRKRMPFNIDTLKVKVGKNYVVSNQTYKTATYKGTNNKNYNLINRGSFSFDDFLKSEGISKADFISRYVGKQTVDAFINGLANATVYIVEPVLSGDDVIPEIDDPKYAKIYNQRKALIKNIRKQLNNTKDPSEQNRLRGILDTLQNQVFELKSDEHRSFGLIVKMMRNDINTVKKILDSGKLNYENLSFAKALIVNYVEILTRDFGGLYEHLPEAVKTEILKFITDSKDLVIRIDKEFIRIANEKVKEVTGKDSVELDGMPIAVKDINIGAAYGYDVRTNPNPIVQTISHEIRTAQVKSNVMSNNFKLIQKKLVQALGDAKNKYDYMLQTDENGKRTGWFVDEKSHAYIKASIEANKDLDEKIRFYALNHTFTVNDEVWKYVEKKTLQYYIDNNYIELTDKDIENGVTLDEKIIKFAAAMVTKRNPHVMKSIMDAVAKNPNFISQSDREFFQEFIDNDGFRYEEIDGEKKYSLERKIHDKWIDPKWTEIQNMDDSNPKKKYYKFVEQWLKKGENFRKQEELYLPWNKIPEKLKPLNVINKAKQFSYEFLSQKISNNIGVVNEETGETERKIPLYMTNGDVSAENQDYNIAAVMEIFANQIINYQEKSEVEDNANLLINMLKQQPVYETNALGEIVVDNQGRKQFKKTTSNNYIQTAHKLSASLYGEGQKKELATNQRTYSNDAKARMKSIKEKIKALRLTVDELNIALNHVETDTKYGGDNDKILEYVKLAAEYKIVESTGRNITGSKIGNSLMFFTSIKALGLNIFAGFAELLQGFTTLFIESSARRYFNDTNAAEAMGLMFKSRVPWDSELKSKINNMARVFDVKGDIVHESEEKVSSKIENKIFFQYAAANFMTNGTFVISMLKFTKVKSLNGTEHSLWDALSFNEDGTVSWNIEADIKLYDDEGKPSQYLVDLIHKSDEILMYNRERKTFIDPIIIDAHLAGRIVGQFKKNWMIGMFYSRFGDKKDANTTGGLASEGFYRTFWKEILSFPTLVDPVTGREYKDISLKNIMKIPVNVFKYMYNFSSLGKSMGTLKNTKYDPMVEANLRKFMRELSFALTLWMAMIVLSNLNKGDDKEWWRTYLINQISRLQRDISLFMGPGAFSSIIKNPAPILSTIADFVSISDTVIKSSVLGDPYDRSGNLKLWNVLDKQLPITNQYNKMKHKFDEAVLYGAY